MAKRLMSRTAFGKTLAEQSVWEERIADARIDIEMTRLLCLKAADMMDRVGNKAAQGEIAMIKVAAPRMALKVLDDAIQAHGGGGVSADFPLAQRLGVGAHAAARRRARRSAPPRHRAAGIQEAPMSEPALDEAALGRVARSAMCEGFSGPFELTKFPSGQSNPTYRIDAASGDYVLRRKPFGQLLPVGACGRPRISPAGGAAPLGFPVPRPFALVRRPGRDRRDLLRDGDGRRAALCRRRRCPISTPDARRRFTAQLVDTLADLHSIDPERSRASATSASRAIISSGRSRAGPGSIAIRRPTICPRWSG